MTAPLLIALLIAGVIVAVFLAVASAEARRLTVTSDSVERPDLPASLDGLRIVFLADIHAGPFFRTRSMDALVERVNGLKPDVVVLGGDYVGGKMGGAQVFYPGAACFDARLAKVAVLGNHDVREGISDARAGLSEAGFTLLENENVAVEAPDGSRIWLAGVDDLYTGKPNVEAAAEGIDPSDFAVLVSHNPDVFATQLEPTAAVWDVALAGHTHAGQITLFGRWGATPSKHGQRYRGGWSEEHGVRIMVSSGVGTVTVPLRFFAAPEIHLITVRGS